MNATFKRYFTVAKPGIIFGNLISVAGGFLLAAKGNVEPMLMIATLVGLSLVVASGCAINNCIDSDIDRKMQRTQTRVTVTGEMSLTAAFFPWLGFRCTWLCHTRHLHQYDRRVFCCLRVHYLRGAI